MPRKTIPGGVLRRPTMKLRILRKVAIIIIKETKKSSTVIV